MMELFALRHGINVMDFLRGTELSRVLQLMHAESVRAGGMFQWSQFFDPSPEITARFEAVAGESVVDWSDIEPEFSK